MFDAVKWVGGFLFLSMSTNLPLFLQMGVLQ